jgi:T4 RnlA family RNA ligase
MNLAQEKIKRAVENCNTEHFNFKEVEFCGEEAVLVNPAIAGTEWTQDNKYLRSVIYRESDYKVLSASFPKFCNWGENPDNFPVPDDIMNSWIIDKIDGSTFIVDYINGQLNVRTRGTVTYETLENAKDFEVALEKYPLIQKWLENHDYLTLIFEIVTPNQRIVLDYKEIDLFLIGAIDKNNYTYENQVTVGSYAKEMCVQRPKVYHFDTITELLDTITKMNGIEGCILYLSGFDPIKIKSEWYLKLHAFKSNATPKNILELFEAQGFPIFDDFKQYILDNFDFECWKMVEYLVTEICVYKKEVDLDIKEIQKFVNNYKDLTDKEFAFKVADKGWKSIAFTLRKGKELSTKTIKNNIKEKL